MTDNDKTYRPEDDEDALEFIHRVIPPLFVTRR